MWYGMREDWSDVVWNERGLDGIDKVRHDILRENLDWCN